MVRATNRGAATLDESAAAIRLLAERGYEATTAENLADAVGVSRSTFFRRFGSKDDVIFADHDVALDRLGRYLAETDTPLPVALREGTIDVLRLLIRDPEAARLRFGLMRDHTSLKERELVITHRYERVFAKYLRESLAETPDWVIASLSASLVAVHNATLRDWLRGRIDDAALEATSRLREAIALFRPWIDPTDAAREQRVLVAVYDHAGTPESVLSAIETQLVLGRPPAGGREGR